MNGYYIEWNFCVSQGVEKLFVGISVLSWEWDHKDRAVEMGGYGIYELSVKCLFGLFDKVYVVIRVNWIVVVMVIV